MATDQRYVVVGLGSIGCRHLTNLKRLKPNSQIAACRLSRKIDDRESMEPCDAVFHNLSDVIKFAPTAAIIAGPASTHAAVACALAAAGIHLFIEKPLAIDATEASEIVDAVTKTKVIAMVGYNLRFSPGLQAVKQAIDDGLIGRVIAARAAVGQYLPDWRPNQDYRLSVSARAELGGGALLELSHELDYLAWMFGVPERAIAQGGTFGNLEINVEDVVEITLQYLDPSMIASVHLDLLDRAGFRELRIIAETGTLCWNGMTDSVQWFNAGSQRWTNLNTTPRGERNDTYLREIEHFLNCIEFGEIPHCDLYHARDVLRIADAARNSMRSGAVSSVANHVA